MLSITADSCPLFPPAVMLTDATARFCESIDEFTYEGPVEVEVLLKVPGEEDKGNYVYMQTCGEVVRREETGLAIRFNGESSLKPFYREKLS